MARGRLRGARARVVADRRSSGDIMVAGGGMEKAIMAVRHVATRAGGERRKVNRVRGGGVNGPCLVLVIE